MQRTLRAALPLVIALFLVASVTARAGHRLDTMILRATRLALLNDGKQGSDITAEVHDSTGRALSAVEVHFQTSLGTLSQQTVTAVGGFARVRLTSGTVAGIAHVTAFTSGGAVANIDIEITDDPTATYQGNQYYQVTGKDFLTYSVTDKIVEAAGADAGARIAYRNATITANRLQLSCVDLTVRAHDNVTLTRGKAVLKATRLYYNIQTAEGYALAEINGKLDKVKLFGEKLRTEHTDVPIPHSFLNFVNLSTRLNVVARAITYFPNDRLQFRRPKFFQDQIQIMALPYFELALNSQELFSEQFMSIGTSGFGLELPVYYNMTPQSSGTLYIRHQQQLGRSYFATDPGWSFDLVQSYNHNNGQSRYEGGMAFTGVTRSDWGFLWNHTQEINSVTQGSFNLTFPQHQGVLSTLDISQQAHGYRWGTDISGGTTFTGLGLTTEQQQVYAETNPKHLGGLKSVMYTVGTSVQSMTTSSSDPGVPNSRLITDGVNLRAFSQPVSIDSMTSLNDSFSMGQVWAISKSGTTAHSGFASTASLAVDHRFKRAGALTASYDFILDPSQLEATGNHRVGLTYNYAPSRKVQISAFGSAYLDAPQTTFFTDVAYRLNNNWRLLTSVTLQTFDGDSFDDIQFTVGRRFGARELQFTYSTYLRRFSLDLTSTQW
jgi:hypothetical protein